MEGECLQNEHKKKKKKSKKEHREKNVEKHIELEKRDIDKKQAMEKPRKRNKEKDRNETQEESTDSSGSNQKKKKKKRKHEKLEDGTEMKGLQDIEEEVKKKKKKKKDRQEAKSENEKSTSTESPSVKLKKEEKADVGQWGKASFESEEQKNKFIRLLGGFKNKGKSEEDKGKTSFFQGVKKFNSAAMSKDEETKLNTKLETQYHQAFDTSRNKRGLGLGYDPNQDRSLKTFHIDKEEASKSIKFE